MGTILQVTFITQYKMMRDREREGERDKKYCVMRQDNNSPSISKCIQTQLISKIASNNLSADEKYGN